MRLTTTFLTSLYALFISTPVFAIHPHVLSNRDHKNRTPAKTIARLQYHPPRALIDTCISLDANASISAVRDLPVVGPLLSPLIVGAIADLCLCLKDIDIYLETNANVQALVNLLGKDALAALLTAIINTSPSARQCSTPPHARRTCNNNDPCHWACIDGYVRQGDICICPPPKSVCNGLCAEYSTGCGASPIPHAMKKSQITTLAQAEASCKVGEVVCGIPGRSGVTNFECINIEDSLDSCGGCMAAHPFLKRKGEQQLIGRDCSQIPHVIQVDCVNRACIVHRCKKGYTTSEDKTKCVSDEGLSSQDKRMRRHRKRGDQKMADAFIYTDVKLLDQLTIIIDLTLQLKRDWSSTSSSVSLSNHDQIRTSHSAIDLLVQSLGRLLGSPTLSSLLSNTDVFLGVALTSKQAINNTGRNSLMNDLEGIIAATLDLTEWLLANPVGQILSSTNNETMSRGSNVPIVLDLSDLLEKLGLNMIDGEATINGLAPSLGTLVNSILDGLDIGPKGNSKHNSNSNSNYNSNTLVNLGTVLDLLLQLVLDSDAIMNVNQTVSNASYRDPTSAWLQNAIDNVVHATVVVVDSLVNGRPVLLELSTLITLGENEKRNLQMSSVDNALEQIIRDLDHLLGALGLLKQSYVSPGQAPNSIESDQQLLGDLATKGQRIDAALSQIGLIKNGYFSAISMLKT